MPTACGTSCTSCGSCAAPCTSSCTAACGGCTGCGTACSGCGGCDASCQVMCGGCAGSCVGSCLGCTSCTSCSGCSGCSGCTSCTGTCSGDCNNACTAASEAEAIANIGSDIVKYEFINKESIDNIKIAINEELIRRNKASLISDFVNTTDIGEQIKTEHINTSIDDYNDISNDDIDESFKISLNDLISATDFDELKNKIKLRKSENIK